AAHRTQRSTMNRQAGPASHPGSAAQARSTPARYRKSPASSAVALEPGVFPQPYIPLFVIQTAAPSGAGTGTRRRYRNLHTLNVTIIDSTCRILLFPLVQ